MDAVMELYDRIVDKRLLVRRVTVAAGHVVVEGQEAVQEETYEQLDIFTDYQALSKQREEEEAALAIKKKFGKNAILKGMNLEEGATTVSRNGQIGGHKA